MQTAFGLARTGEEGALEMLVIKEGKCLSSEEDLPSHHKTYITLLEFKQVMDKDKVWRGNKKEDEATNDNDNEDNEDNDDSNNKNNDNKYNDNKDNDKLKICELWYGSKHRSIETDNIFGIALKRAFTW